MARPLILFSFLFSFLNGFSQTEMKKDSSVYSEKRYIIWISPSKATNVYGLMFNVWPRNDGYIYDKYPRIDGVEINIMPLSIFYPFILAMNSIIPQKEMLRELNVDTLNFNTFKKINGLQIGLANLEPSLINGLDINGSGSMYSKVNGVTISAVINKHYIINGVTISILGNHDYKCNGMQIGLYNSTLNLRGIQVGLWNKNQKRSLPIINWCFKK